MDNEATAKGGPAGATHGAVGRPGAQFTIHCSSEFPPTRWRKDWLTFSDGKKAGRCTLDHGWVEETRQFGAVSITVLSGPSGELSCLSPTCSPD